MGTEDSGVATLCCGVATSFPRPSTAGQLFATPSRGAGLLVIRHIPIGLTTFQGVTPDSPSRERPSRAWACVLHFFQEAPHWAQCFLGVERYSRLTSAARRSVFGAPFRMA